MTQGGITALNVANNNYIYATNTGIPGDVFMSNDNGNSWRNVAEDLAMKMSDIVTDDSNYVYVISAFNGVFRSKDDGRTWVSVNDSLENDNISAISIMQNGILLLGVDKDLYVSNNFGDYWEKRIDNLTTGYISSIYADSSNQIYIGTTKGEVFFSKDVGVSFELISQDFEVGEITCFDSRNDGALIAGTSIMGVLLTSDTGASWKYINKNLTNYYCTSLLVDSSNSVYFGAHEGLFKSDSNLANWELLKTESDGGILLDKNIKGEIFVASYSGLSKYNPISKDWKWLRGFESSAMLINDSSYIFIGTYQSGIYRSVDGGENWENVYTHDDEYWTTIRGFAKNSLGEIYASTDLGIIKSADNGKTWELVNTEIVASTLSSSSNNVIYAGVYGSGVFRSEDAGKTWVQINEGFSNTNITSLVSNSGGKTYLGIWGSNAGVFEISDDLDYWTKVNTGLSSTNVNTLTLDNNEFLYAGTRDGLLFRSNGATTFIKSSSPFSPKIYKLEQNYPNPFNPSTEIGYTLLERGFVTLSVYNVLGEKVSTLVSKEQNMGKHYITFNGSGLTSGVYFYRLSTKNYSNIKKMLLLR